MTNIPLMQNDIKTALSSVGLVSVPPPLINEMASLCSSLRISPKELAETWEAHSLSKNVDALNDVTFSAYKNALMKESENRHVSSEHKNMTIVPRKSLGKRSFPSSSVTPSPMTKRIDRVRSGVSAIDAVVMENVPSSPSKSHIIPSDGGDLIEQRVVTPPKVLSVAKYSDRLDSGTVIASFNPHNLPTTVDLMRSKSSSEWEKFGKNRSCQISWHSESYHPRESFRHMFAPLEKRANALEGRLVRIGEAICEAFCIKREDDEDARDSEKLNEHASEIAPLAPVGIPKQNKVCCVGRICNLAHDGKMNCTSVVLEGSLRFSSGQRIKVDLSCLTSPDNRGSQSQGYSLFPGQIVAIEGVNSTGKTIRASRLHEGIPPSPELIPASSLLDWQYGAKWQNGNPLSIVTVCGPYTTSENLDYLPLLDMLHRISKDRPDVVIMCGPFVDMRQELVSSGETTVKADDGTEKKVSYEYLFLDKISSSLEEVYLENPEIKTQFVLVPSTDDAICESVYPQPPLSDEVIKGNESTSTEFTSLGLRYVDIAGRQDRKGTSPKRVHCVSNPCTIRINELSIGITSSDIIRDISSNEVRANLPAGTRMTRIAQHLIQQRSYYPMFPAAKGACLDLTRMEQWEIPCQPDILIVPSKLTTFAKQVLDNTIVVNPGELTKGRTGGTYAVIDVHPTKREIIDEAMRADVKILNRVQDRTRVDIIRI